MTAKQLFKPGDRVYVEYDPFNGDWNISGATVAIVQDLDPLLAEVVMLDSKKGTKYKSCFVNIKSLVHEDIYNSPLYQALK